MLSVQEIEFATNYTVNPRISGAPFAKQKVPRYEGVLDKRGSRKIVVHPCKYF